MLLIEQMLFFFFFKGLDVLLKEVQALEGKLFH